MQRDVFFSGEITPDLSNPGATPTLTVLTAPPNIKEKKYILIILLSKFSTQSVVSID